MFSIKDSLYQQKSGRVGSSLVYRSVVMHDLPRGENMSATLSLKLHFATTLFVLVLLPFRLLACNVCNVGRKRLVQCGGCGHLHLGGHALNPA